MNANTLNQFAVYAWGTLIRPSVTFEKLLVEPKHIVYRSATILIVGMLY